MLRIRTRICAQLRDYAFNGDIAHLLRPISCVRALKPIGDRVTAPTLCSNTGHDLTRSRSRAGCKVDGLELSLI